LPGTDGAGQDRRAGEGGKNYRKKEQKLFHV